MTAQSYSAWPIIGSSSERVATAASRNTAPITMVFKNWKAAPTAGTPAMRLSRCRQPKASSAAIQPRRQPHQRQKAASASPRNSHSSLNPTSSRGAQDHPAVRQRPAVAASVACDAVQNRAATAAATSSSSGSRCRGRTGACGAAKAEPVRDHRTSDGGDQHQRRHLQLGPEVLHHEGAAGVRDARLAASPQASRPKAIASTPQTRSAAVQRTRPLSVVSSSIPLLLVAAQAAARIQRLRSRIDTMPARHRKTTAR